MAQAESGRLPAAKNLADILDSGTGEPFRSRRFRRRQRLTPMHESVLPDVLPCFNFRWRYAHMGRPFRGRTGKTVWGSPSPGNSSGTFGPLCSRLPGLDPHTLLRSALPGRIRWSGSLQGRFGFRGISRRTGVQFWSPVPAAPFFLQQLFNTSRRLTASIPGGILDPVAAVIVPLASLAGIPELATEPFGSVIQPTAQELFWSGCRPFLQALFAGPLFFDFIDYPSPPKREKGPQARPFSAKLCCVQLLHKLGGHQFIEPGVFREAVHKRHDGAAAFDEATA